MKHYLTTQPLSNMRPIASRSLDENTEIFVMDRALIRENVLVHLDSLHRSVGHSMIHSVFPLEAKGVNPMF